MKPTGAVRLDIKQSLTVDNTFIQAASTDSSRNLDDLFQLNQEKTNMTRPGNLGFYFPDFEFGIYILPFQCQVYTLL